MKVSTYVMAGLLVGTILTTTTASAEGLQCTISGTGPDSNNTCLQYVGRTCTVTNNNVITITNSNDQQSESGDANSSGNGTGGDATSGDASNDNSTVVNGTIDNTGACVAAVVPTTPTPTPTPTPEQPGKVESAQVQAPVGGVKAGSGGADQSGVIAALLAASVLAVGAGLRQLRVQKQL